MLRGTSTEVLGLPADTELFDEQESQLDERLAALDERARAGAQRLVPFVSQEMATKIQRDHRGLGRTLVFSPARLAFHSVASVMGSAMLNHRHVLLGWASIVERADDLARTFGNELFIRPNGSNKAFTGFSVSMDRLRAEHGALSQIEHVPADELCVVAPAQALMPTEWRFWVVDGAPATWAPYRWSDVIRGPDPSLEAPARPAESLPPAVVDFARRAARQTEIIDSAVVMDVALTDDGPRIVELNPLSTSGFYPGMDLGTLLEALEVIFA